MVRNVKLRSFFNKSAKPFSSKSKLFIPKSTWTPSASLLNNDVINTINEIENNTVELIKNASKITRHNEIFIKLKDKPNLSVSEFDSLNKLRKNKDIIIKSADKGGATVIMDIENYIFEAHRQLNDCNYYKVLDNPIFTNNIPGIKAILQKMKNALETIKDQIVTLERVASALAKRVTIVGVSVGLSLDEAIRGRVAKLNQHLSRGSWDFIPPLPVEDVGVRAKDSYKIHFDQATLDRVAMNIRNHILNPPLN